MNTNRLPALQIRVQRILEQADIASEPEAKADLACFACILTSAMIEVACRDYISRYVTKRAHVTVLSYVSNRLYFFQNAKSTDIDGLLRGFSSELAESFATQIGDEGKDAIDSVVNKKNELVHGKGAGIGLDAMKRYHKDVIKVIEILRDLLVN